MKRSELVFAAIQVPLDYIMILLAAAAAYGLRFLGFFTDLRPVTFGLSVFDFVQVIAPIAPFALLIFAVLGFYRIGRHQNVADDLVKVSIGLTVAVTAFIFYVFFSRTLYESRFLIIAVWFFSIFFVTFGRFLLRRVQILMYKRGRGLHRVVLVGSGRTTMRLKQEYSQPELGHTIVASYDTLSDGVFKKLKKYAKKPGVDEIIVTNTGLPNDQLYALHRIAENHKWEFSIVPDMFGTISPNFEIRDVGGIPLFELRHTPLEGWWRIIKRLIDFIGSVVLLILLAPLFVIVALVVKLDAKGPVFVRLERVNRDGVFKLYKFRSMIDDAHRLKKQLMEQNERSGPLFKMKDDPRVTRSGKFLRASRIDELPQLFNVLKGQMSLVGPRPHEPEEVAKFDEHHKRVLGINSGMTGLAQVSGSSDLDFEEEVRLDIYYMENWSLRMDLSILFRTVRVVLFRQFGS